MTTQVETPDTRLDWLKWAASLALVASGLVAFYYFEGHSLLLRVVGLLVVLGVAGAILLKTGVGRSAADFVGEARVEVRKVVWPTRKETVQTTSLIIAMVTLFAVLLWLLDMMLAWGVRALIG
jgi:preprotein translocase subunit SecE